MLPSIEEAWSLPIPAELTSRQGALNTAQAQQVRSSLLLLKQYVLEDEASSCYFQMVSLHQRAAGDLHLANVK